MLAQTSEGMSVYLFTEKNSKGERKIAGIFEPVSEDLVATIDQQKDFLQKNILSSFKKKPDEINISLSDRYSGCMLGLACGDAVGAAVELRKPGTFFHLTDMVGGGPYNLKAGQWTDDTSMALCLAASLIENHNKEDDGFNPKDQVKKYIQWRDTGYMSSIGRCFDIGNTVATALNEFSRTNEPYSGPTDRYSAGNGSVMRLAPIPLRYFNSIEKTARYAELSSKVTHGAEEAVDACHLFSLLINKALQGESKESILFETEPLKKLSPEINKIRKGSYTLKTRREICGKSYVINSLEAALWCFYTTSNLEEAILKSANLGNDADTTAAICGQLAGAHYGEKSIPEHWKEKLTEYKMIKNIAKKLYDIRLN